MAELPLTQPQLQDLIGILVQYGELATELQRENFYDATGYSFVPNLTENIHITLDTRNFCYAFVRVLRRYGNLPNSDRPALYPLLVYLQDKVAGHPKELAKIEALLALVVPPSQSNPHPANPHELFQTAMTHFLAQQWAEALALFQQLKAQNYPLRTLNQLIQQAEQGVSVSTRRREMTARYKSVVALTHHDIALAKTEWLAFLEEYPEFSEKDDSKNLPTLFERHALLDIMADMKRSIKERAQAGIELAKIGDPRPGVGLRDDGVPDIVWCEVLGRDKGRPPVKIGGDHTILEILGEYTPYTLPAQTINLPTFRIAKYPITYHQFQAFIDDEGFENNQWWEKGDDRSSYDQSFKHWNHPRSNITWYAAMAYCKWLSVKLGMTVRLPTEEEWEKAARGDDGRYYPWGNDYISGYANIDETYEHEDKDRKITKVGPHYLKQTSSVGIYPPESASPYGVMDMAGNVSEWTLSAFGAEDRQAEKQTRRTLHNQAIRVVRGGSWNDFHRIARVAARYWDPPNPNNRNMNIGFRVVVSSASNRSGL